MPLTETMTIGLESSDFIRMFPTVVWKFQLREEVAAAINKTIRYRLEEMRASAPERLPGASWQSGYSLHRLDEFSDLVECTQATTQEVLSFLKIGSQAFEITGCWANVHGRGASHGVHSHPNNFLSGVPIPSIFMTRACRPRFSTPDHTNSPRTIRIRWWCA